MSFIIERRNSVIRYLPEYAGKIEDRDYKKEIEDSRYKLK